MTTKFILTVAAMAVLVASPALAQRAPRSPAPFVPGLQQGGDPNVSVNGRAVGRDPDPNIRFELRRQAPIANGSF